MRNKMLFITGILLLHFNFKSQAQYIQSLTVIPPNPTTADSITIIADCIFPSSGCDLYSQAVFVNGNDIYANALHCLGILTVICPNTDTITINPLPPGTYTFHFQLDAGAGPAPCTPGIVPGPDDSVSFVVSPAVGLSKTISQDAISVFPNPATSSFQIKGLEATQYPVQLEIFSPDGKLVSKAKVSHELQNIDIHLLPAGFYQFQITLPDASRMMIGVLKNDFK